MIGDRQHEPPSREGAVIAALRAALQPDAEEVLRLNNNQTTACGGVALADPWVSRMEVLGAFNRLEAIETQQAAILSLLHGLLYTSWEVVRELHLGTDGRITVANEEFAGLQQLVRWIWDEPGYESPLRFRPRRSMLPFVERLGRIEAKARRKAG